MQCLNPKLVQDYPEFFIDRYETIMLNMRYATDQVEQASKHLSDAIADYSKQALALSDLYSECGFDEFNDLLQQISSLSTAWSQ